MTTTNAKPGTTLAMFLERTQAPGSTLLADFHALRARCERLQAALGRADWYLAHWLSGGEMAGVVFGPHGDNMIAATHAEATRLIPDAGANHYSPWNAALAGEGK